MSERWKAKIAVAAISAAVGTAPLCSCRGPKEEPASSTKAEAPAAAPADAASPSAEPAAARADTLAIELSAEAAEAGITDLPRSAPRWVLMADSFVQSTLVHPEVRKDLVLPPERILEPVTMTEVQQNAKPVKCLGVAGVYLDALPPDGAEAMECRQEVRGGGGGYVQTSSEMRFVGSGRFWEKMFWQPKFRRWDRMTEADRLRERRLVLEKQHGPMRQAEALQQYQAKKMTSGADANAFLKAYEPRIIYELAGLKLDQLQ